MSETERYKWLCKIKIDVENIIENSAKRIEKDKNLEPHHTLVQYAFEIPDLKYIFVDSNKYLFTLWGFYKDEHKQNEDPKIVKLVKTEIKKHESSINIDPVPPPPPPDIVPTPKEIPSIEQILGLIEDDQEYKKVKNKKISKNKVYEKLSPYFTLKPYCPTPKNQGKYGTCVAWACSYAGVTIVEAIERKLKGQTEEIDKLVYSPHFLYRIVKKSNDINCSEGAVIPKALDIIKLYGVPRMNDFNVECAKEIPKEIYKLAKQRTIDTYVRLFEIGDNEETKIKKVKKAISNLHPVIIGFKVYESFRHVKEVWNGHEDRKGEGHAMCVVSWDDAKEGGAFEIINSWGTKWANKGFVWVKYKDFATHTRYAFEINGIEKADVKTNTVNEISVINENWFQWIIRKIKNFFVSKQ